MSNRDFLRCGGAGTAADTEWTCDKIAAEMELIKLNSGKQPRVVTALMKLKQYLFRSAAKKTVSLMESFQH